MRVWSNPTKVRHNVKISGASTFCSLYPWSGQCPKYTGCSPLSHFPWDSAIHHLLHLTEKINGKGVLWRVTCTSISTNSKTLRCQHPRSHSLCLSGPRDQPFPRTVGCWTSGTGRRMGVKGRNCELTVQRRLVFR